MSVPEPLLAAKRTATARFLAEQPPEMTSHVFASSFETKGLIPVAVAEAMPLANVHAVGVGRKRVGGEDTGESSLRFYVARKLPQDRLSGEGVLPREIEGVPTDVIEAPPAFVTRAGAQCSGGRRGSQRPVVGGISTAHEQVTVGTLGYFCRSTAPDDEPGAVYVLSNNHVYADVNDAGAGDPLLQPGPADGGSSSHRIAALTRYVPIRLGGSVENRVDAAMGRLEEEVDWERRICTLGAVSGTAEAREDGSVRKHGRTSGYTEGVVTDESIDALVGMDHDDPGVRALFVDQVRIAAVRGHPAFGLGGDSGSLVLEEDSQQAVALYFAGPRDGSYGLANKIEDVEDELEIELI